MGSRGGELRGVLNAVSGSARQLYLLLRCINFNSKAHVRISKEGLRFTVEEGRIMQGIAFLDRSLFTAYTFNAPDSANQPRRVDSIEGVDEEEYEVPPFQISLSALLETLQIFGVGDINNGKDRWSSRNEPLYQSSFEPRAVLGTGGICRLSYNSPGDPLVILLEESDVTTTCDLTTYEPETYQEDLPLQKDAIMQKIIMRASWLHDAINELSSTSPTRLTIASSPQAPYFTLSSTGPLGSATVEFSKDPPQLLETFQVPRRTVNTYKYSLIQGASRAMASASKVSIRSDEQGVLSLQFMIEVENGSASEAGAGTGPGVAFVDFRFVAYVDQDDDEASEDG